MGGSRAHIVPVTGDIGALTNIRCPTCGETIPISEALQNELAEHAEAKVREQLFRQQKAVAAKEATLQARETAVATAEVKIEARVQQRLTAERATIEDKSRERARADVAVELSDLRAQADEKDQKLREVEQAELLLRKEKRDLEDQKRTLEVEVTRRIDAERTKIREQATQEAIDQHHLKDAEKDRKLQDALRMNDDLRRRLQQGSQQTQGEVLEVELEQFLSTQFPSDHVDPVAKGVRGADLIQRVHTRAGHYCGTILWESKHTKNWSEGWIEKVRNDQREARADVAVIISTTLPKEVSGLAFRDGVWIADYRVTSGLATALRNGLLDVALARTAAAGKDEAAEALFGYLTGPEFRQRVDGVVRTFVAMKEDLEEEKRVAARRWAKREKQLERVIENTSGMYGDLQGLLGSSMKPIPMLDEREKETAVEQGAEPA